MSLLRQCVEWTPKAGPCLWFYYVLASLLAIAEGIYVFNSQRCYSLDLLLAIRKSGIILG